MFKINFKKILFYSCVLLCCFKIKGQSRVYKNYTVEDGLPSSEVYSAFQDSKGYMWFATDAGVSRFNGYEFENFDTNDGLTDNTVFLITEDHIGRIWFGTFNLKLCYYYNDSIYPYQYNDNLSKALKSKGVIYSMHVDSLDNVWLGLIYAKGNIVKVSANGGVSELFKTEELAQYKMYVFNNHDVWSYYGEVNNQEIYSGEKVKVSIKHKEGVNEFEIIRDIKRPKISMAYMIRHGDDILFYDRQSDIHYLLEKKNAYRPKKIFYTDVNGISYGVSDLYSSTSHLWISTENNGVYKLRLENDSLIVEDHFLKKKRIARVFKDNRDGIWFQSLNEGVYYLSSESMKARKIKNEKLYAIEVDTLTGNLYASLENKSVVKMNKNMGDFEYEVITSLLYKSAALKFNYEKGMLFLGGGTPFINYYKGGELGAYKKKWI